ncbi:MAG: divalent-cation tolerance protein CutA [Hyphomonadaceae bacterium]
MQPLILYATWPDAAAAEACAAALIEARLAACVTILPAARSTFRWNEKIIIEAESLMLAKTTLAQAAAARELIAARHPYEIPCILGISIDSNNSDASYLAWLAGETR